MANVDDKAKNPTGPTSRSGCPPRGEWRVELKTDTRTFLDNHHASIEWLARTIKEMAESAALGYVLCEGCGEPITDELARVTGGWCGPCFRGARQNVIDAVEALVDGARTPIPIDRPPRKRYGSRGSKVTRRKAEQAKRAALRRLRHMNPVQYDLLLASEREKRGLEPYPLARLVRVETVEDETAYDSANGAQDSHADGS